MGETKDKRDFIRPEMRAALLTNRQGKLTSAQWREVVSEPLVPILLLMLPGILILRSALVTLLVGGLWIIGAAAVVGIGLMLALRARRYARVALEFAVLRAADPQRPSWMWWRPQVFLDSNGEPLRFHRSLAPPTGIQPGREYLVYYFTEASGKTLLSLGAVDHPDADHWRPSSHFEGRRQRRMSQG